MGKIKGITIVLVDRTQVDTDQFGAPIYETEDIEIDNVLVSPSNSTDIVDAQNLYGKKAIYTLCIPKGDSHNWLDKEVKFFGRTWKTFGFPLEGIEEMIPLEWNKKVMVEAYE